ncbi:MAG: FHA domain-containing protein [Alphaproteobacteria bacterium GM202ARS2]|nr:FHA domain-containing protein [Alphaproteobacteria bacterium GM202ARS2]
MAQEAETQETEHEQTAAETGAPEAGTPEVDSPGHASAPQDSPAPLAPAAEAPPADTSAPDHNKQATSENEDSSSPQDNETAQEQQQEQGKDPAPQQQDSVGEVIEQPTLRVLSGFHVGAEVILADSDAVIGSDEDCDIVLADPAVARRHARLTYQQGAYTLEAIGDNRVRVDGALLKAPQGLRQDMIISFGQVHVAFGTLTTAWHDLALPEPKDDSDSPDVAQAMHAQAAHAGKEHTPQQQENGLDKKDDTPATDTPDTSPDKPHDSLEPLQGEVIATLPRHRKRHSRLRTIAVPGLALAASLNLALWVFDDDGTGVPDIASLFAGVLHEDHDALEAYDEPYSIFTRAGTSADVRARHAAPQSSPHSDSRPAPVKVDKRPLKALVADALAKNSTYRGKFQVQGDETPQPGQPAVVTVEGYVRSHSALASLKHFVDSAIPQNKGIVRYKVTITSTLAMALRAELESRGFHNVSVRDKGAGNFAAVGLVATKVRLRQALQDIALSLPRLQAIHDRVATLDEVVRYLHAQLDAAGLSLKVMVPQHGQTDSDKAQDKHDDVEEHENTVSVSGLVNKADYKKWQQIATSVTQKYKPWLSLDDQVVNVRGFSLDVLSAVHGPHSFITVRHPRNGQNQDYAVGSVLPNGFRLVDVGSDHLVLTWQGRTYTYVLGEDHDTRTTDLRP